MLTGVFINAESALAASCTQQWSGQCYVGVVSNIQYNYGARATIGTPSHFYGHGSNEDTYMFINAQSWENPRRAYMDTGYLYVADNFCGVQPVAYWAYADSAPYDLNTNPAGGGIADGCSDITVSGDNEYSVYYNSDDGLWYHTIKQNGSSNIIILFSEPGGDVEIHNSQPAGYTNALHITSFGQSNGTDIQIGGANAGSPIYTTNISYKTTMNGNNNFVGMGQSPNAPFYFGIPNTCPGSSCPYNASSGNSGGVWYTTVWTQENLPY